MHMYIKQHRSLRYVFHYGIVMSVEAIQIFVVAQQNVGFQAVLVIRIDTRSYTRISTYPVTGMDVEDSAHQVGATMSHFP